jgi:hypothetical protein
MIDFIGVGAPKCATSWIFRCLQEHPDICVPKGKETHFFKQYDNPENHIHEYREYFAHCNRGQIAGEYSVTYFSDPDAPEQIHSIYPNAKIIISIRGYVDRALSHLRHAQSRNKVPNDSSIEKAVNQDPSIVEDGLYAKHIQRYMKLFSKQNVHLILFKDIVNNPHKTIADLYDFLEAKKEFVPSVLDKRYNSTEARDSLFWSSTQNIYRYLRDYESGVVLINFLRSLGLDRVWLERFLKIFPARNKVEISEQDRAYLRSLFKQDAEMLFKKFNIEL